jgi:hypothetical protein
MFLLTWRPNCNAYIFFYTALHVTKNLIFFCVCANEMYWSIWDMARTCFNYWNLQSVITLNLWKQELWFVCNTLYIICNLSTYKVSNWYIFILFDIARTRILYRNLQRAITDKLWKEELWFFCTALLHVIYLPIKFQVDTSYSRVVERTQECDRQADGTDRQTDNEVEPCTYSDSFKGNIHVASCCFGIKWLHIRIK